LKPDRTYSWLENGEQVNPAERFLLQTLVSRPSLFVRNGVAYAAIRRWRSSVKEYQIDALQAIKCSPSPDFVKTICDDFEQTLTQILGGNAYRYVVPVPCSRSGPECLSRQVARSLAARLQLPKRRALDIAPARGASHPKANLRRPPMRLRDFTFTSLSDAV